MGLVKRTYVDGETVITAENLNAIQDAIIENEETIEDQGEAIEGKYSKPSGGIPKTDLASAVQTSLGKADTALQRSDIDNTLTVTGKAADAKKTGDEISDVKNTLSHKADVITDTASGPIASFPDGADGLQVKDLTVGIEPVQDLHGYDNPWPAGGGKNLLPLTLANLKAINTGGTWTNNSYSFNGAIFSIQTDNNGNVTGILANASSAPSADAVLYIDSTSLSNYSTYGGVSIIVNGCPSGGSSSTYAMTAYRTGTGSAFDIGSGATINWPSDVAYYNICILIRSAVTNILFKPMARFSTVSDATFAPYSNICPISGWTGCNVTKTGKNLWSIGDISTESESEIAFNLKAGVYTLHGVSNGTQDKAISLRFNHSDSTSTLFTFSNYAGTTLALSKDVVSLNWYIHSFTSGYKVERVQLEPGSTASAYEAYQGATIPISWQSEAGTVYAASLDALAGSLKVRPYYASYNGETLVGPWISSMDAYTPGGTPTTGAQVIDFGGSETSYSLDAIALNTLLGQNNIWADRGPSTVEYQADTKLYIQKINTPMDDDMIADAQIASGKYFIINNNLYLSTTTILAGDPIKPGTNCTLTNLAAALNAINS